jgi:hypothetical protein
VRPTIDVDVIAEITTPIEYFDFAESLRNTGFSEDAREGAPVCRWIYEDLILDVMPTEDCVLGFTKRWYKDAIPSAEDFPLPNGSNIRVISAVYFLGTKMEAFLGRGQRDFLSSHDLEDFVAVIDGRDAIPSEIFAAPIDLRRFLAQSVRELLSEPQFVDALPGYLLPDEISQQRLPSLLHKLRAISQG